MARRHLTNKLVKREEITEELKKIEGSLEDYITPNGKIYKDYGNGMFYPKTTYVNKVNGYVYVSLTFPKGQVSRRVHNLLAKAFIPNKESLPIVGHKNNIKTDNRLENLYWTTIQENTQKAYDDGLAKNDKGFKDSQSQAVCVYDMNLRHIKTYGSEREASYALHITVGGISYQCKHKMSGRPRSGYYFRYLTEVINKGFVL